MHMIEHGEIVLADVNAPVLPQANTTQVNSTNQQSTSKTLPSESLLNTITTTEQVIKQECLNSSSTTIPLNVDCNHVKEEYNDNDEECEDCVNGICGLLGENDEDEGEYMSDCDEECEDCVKGICGLVGENDNADNVDESGVDMQIGLHQKDQPNATLGNELAVEIISDVIDGSNQSSENVNALLLINESKQQIRRVRNVTKQMENQPQNSDSCQSAQPVIELEMFVDHQSSNEVTSDKRKSVTETSKAVKKVKRQNVDAIHQDEEETHKIVILELNCTEPSCKTILKSNKMWKEHLWTFHGQTPYKHLDDNVRTNQYGQTEYPCPECEVVSKSQEALKTHWRYFHQAGKFQCWVCAFVANFHGEVRNHYRQNHYSSKFQCTHHSCNRAFMSMSNLERHRRIHSGETPFKCAWNNCGASFNQIENATKHVRVQHFHLLQTVKKQKELNIFDERDPKAYVQVMLGD